MIGARRQSVHELSWKSSVASTVIQRRSVSSRFPRKRPRSVTLVVSAHAVQATGGRRTRRIRNATMCSSSNFRPCVVVIGAVRAAPYRRKYRLHCTDRIVPRAPDQDLRLGADTRMRITIETSFVFRPRKIKSSQQVYIPGVRAILKSP
jgi:hypothetical protein